MAKSKREMPHIDFISQLIKRHISIRLSGEREFLQSQNSKKSSSGEEFETISLLTVKGSFTENEQFPRWEIEVTQIQSSLPTLVGFEISSKKANTLKKKQIPLPENCQQGRNERDKKQRVDFKLEENSLSNKNQECSKPWGPSFEKTNANKLHILVTF